MSTALPTGVGTSMRWTDGKREFETVPGASCSVSGLPLGTGASSKGRMSAHCRRGTDRYAATAATRPAFSDVESTASGSGTVRQRPSTARWHGLRSSRGSRGPSSE